MKYLRLGISMHLFLGIHPVQPARIVGAASVAIGQGRSLEEMESPLNRLLQLICDNCAAYFMRHLVTVQRVYILMPVRSQVER